MKVDFKARHLFEGIQNKFEVFCTFRISSRKKKCCHLHIVAILIPPLMVSIANPLISHTHFAPSRIIVNA